MYVFFLLTLVFLLYLYLKQSVLVVLFVLFPCLVLALRHKLKGYLDLFKKILYKSFFCEPILYIDPFIWWTHVYLSDRRILMEGQVAVGANNNDGGQVRRVHIVYYLSRNGRIEHPHLIRIHHVSRNGIHLRG